MLREGQSPLNKAVIKSGRLPEDIVEQTEFFDTVFEQAKDLEPPYGFYHSRHGVFYDGLEASLRKVEELVAAVNPNLTPEHLVSESYQRDDIAREIASMPVGVRTELRVLRLAKLTLLGQLVDLQQLPHLGAQTVEPGMLDTPPFCRQGDNHNTENRTQACMNACVRMVLAGMLGGCNPDERVLEQCLQRHHGGWLAEDEVYFKLFGTTKVRQASGLRTDVVEITGSDLNAISKVAAAFKARNAGGQVYAVVSIGSSNIVRQDVWHTNVLLSADEDSVTCHDPAFRDGRPHKVLPKDVFARRWAIGLNRAHLILTRPDSPQPAL